MQQRHLLVLHPRQLLLHRHLLLLHTSEQLHHLSMLLLHLLHLQLHALQRHCKLWVVGKEPCNAMNEWRYSSSFPTLNHLSSRRHTVIEELKYAHPPVPGKS